MNKILFLCIICSFISFIHANHSSKDIKSIKQSILVKCKHDMNGHSNTMIKSCVDQSVRAYEKIQEYKKSHPITTQRILNQMKSDGYALIEACIRQEIHAESSLKQL